MGTTVAGPVGSHDSDWTSAETADGRNVGLSLGGAFDEGRRAAGAVACFARFSKSTTTALSAASTRHRADDLPAYLVIVIVGDLLLPVILWIEVDYVPSLAFQLGVYLPITALASIALLQPVKGAVVALQWSLRMHGFGVHPPDELQV